MVYYEPLDQSEDCLRLLKILPPQKNNPEICCELESRTFKSKPDYESLSYTWGTGPASHRIMIHGEPFFVGENLYQALDHLRRPSEPRVLWVDAICINQADVMERNYQVGLMAFIYPRARRVLVWLGDSPSPLPKEEDDNGVWDNEESCLGLARHPYWTRIWIVQELVLAREILILYGGREFIWWKLASKFAGELAEELKKTAAPIMRQRDIRHTDEHRLEKLIENFRQAQCKEPRDKIFGLLGMAHDCDSDVLEVDYEVSYFSLYSSMIELHKSMPQASLDASWLSIERSVMLMRFSQLVQRTLGGLVEEDAEARAPSKGPKQFHTVRGAVSGEILYLGPTYTETVSSLRANKTWKRAYEGCYHGGKLSGIERLRGEDEAYSRAILDWDENRLKTIRAVHGNTSYGYRLHGDDEFINVDQDALSKPDGSEPRRFLATNVLLGFVPPEARLGDLICRFWDSDVAVVVRRIGGELTDRWRIVGKADISTTVRRGEDNDDQRSMRYSIDDFYQLNGETEMDRLRVALTRDAFKNMINFRLDTETLQKLTS